MVICSKTSTFIFQLLYVLILLSFISLFMIFLSYIQTWNSSSLHAVLRASICIFAWLSIMRTFFPFKTCVHSFLLFHQMIHLFFFYFFLFSNYEKWFFSSKKLFWFLKYSNFCNFFSSFPHFPNSKGQMKVEWFLMSWIGLHKLADVIFRIIQKLLYIT